MGNMGNLIDFTVMNGRIFKKYYESTKTINITTKICTYKNYCMFDTTS